MGTNDSQAPKDAMISLADEEAVKQVLVNSVLGLWDVVNNLTRLRPSKRERYRVTIFGSARAKPGTLRLRRDQASRRRVGGDGLRHHHRRRPRADAGGQRRRRRLRRIALNPSASASICPSSRKSTRSSARRSSTGRSSRACTSSC